MVQVDVFWGYGWGASLAAAAGTKLAQSEKPFETGYFVKTLLFLSLFWAPTGMLLLIRHPSWETMQAADTFASMSEWVILGFGITNITQGILGFAAGLWLVRRQKFYLAQLNWILGYFGMFFILLYGWDGLGYDRFLYDRDLWAGNPAWTPGIGTADGVWIAIGRHLLSSVATTLYIDGVWLLPPFFYLATRWLRDSGGPGTPSTLRLTGTYLFGVFGIGFAAAAFCAVTVRLVAYGLGAGDHVARGLGQIPPDTGAHVAAYFIGLPLALFILWHTLLKESRPFARSIQSLTTATAGGEHAS